VHDCEDSLELVNNVAQWLVVGISELKSAETARTFTYTKTALAHIQPQLGRIT